MYSSRIHTACCNCVFPATHDPYCHSCPLPAMHAPLPCTSPHHTSPTTTHAPCHACSTPVDRILDTRLWVVINAVNQIDRNTEKRSLEMAVQFLVHEVRMVGNSHLLKVYLLRNSLEYQMKHKVSTNSFAKETFFRRLTVKWRSPESNFLYFKAVFDEIRPNNWLTLPSLGWEPHLGYPESATVI